MDLQLLVNEVLYGTLLNKIIKIIVLITPGFYLVTLTGTLTEYGLMELASEGNWFTWTNNRQEHDSFWGRLDRMFCIVRWLNLFPYSKVHCLPICGL